MSIYKIDYKALRQSPSMAELLSALERGFREFNIDFYLVGAVARDVWMGGIYKIAPRRTTTDIDFAVLINDSATYEALKEYLITNEGFYASKENAFVLLWKDKTAVDLLPFGAIADEEGTVAVQGTGFTTVHVPGFNEVYQEGLPEVALDEKHTFKFCTLPGMVVLKLIAWDDRPEVRRDDIIDISDILQHFFDMYNEIIWEQHNDLFKDESDNLLLIAARVMGREMNKIARRNEKIIDRIKVILTGKETNEVNSNIATIMVDYFKNTLEDNMQLLQALKAGFLE